MAWRSLFWMALAALVPGLGAPTGVAAQSPSTCDGYPRADIGMAPGFCAGLILGPPTPTFSSRKLRLPRSLIQLPGGDWIISDLGGWGATRGAIWRLRAAPGRHAILTPLLTGLNLPHALAIGPDGLVYVGEMSRIIRFDAAAPDPAATLEVVIGGLPDNRLHDNRHPLSKFIFAGDGALIVNIGAPSDQCLTPAGTASGPTCAEAEGADPSASLRRYPFLGLKAGKGRWGADYSILARGLRNSVALAAHPSGTILQGENSYDFAGRWSPFDEINQIVPGGNYGWPYCADVEAPTPGWRGKADCSRFKPPALLLPPHAAPLDMLWYRGAMFPGLDGRLLITWHGYRATAGRLAAYEVDDRGLPVTGPRARYDVYGGASRRYFTGPSANARILTPGWAASRTRRQGSPVGVAVAADGAIWVTDDRAGQVLRIAADRP